MKIENVSGTSGENRFRPYHIAFLAVLIVGTIFVAHLEHGKQENTQFQMEEGAVFGTTYHIKYQYGENLHDSIIARLKAIDGSLSMFNPTSTVSNINRGECMKADSLVTCVWNMSRSISKETDGAFDPTVAPLVNIWGFGYKTRQLPDKAIIDSLRELVGWQRIYIQDGNFCKEDPRMVIDFSAVAKGFGVDHVANLFRNLGIKNFMVEIGGEIVAQGTNPKGEAWRIGINKPDDDSTGTNNELQEVIEVHDGALATSGNYRNFYIEGGRKIAHTIDPKTGYPAKQSILSSTVKAPSCAMADGYATAFMVMGMERSQKFLQKHPQLQAYFIYADESGQYQTWHTPSFYETEENK
ncbi:MAG: FAD:protein FMN transferase [Bacteroidaceae bacterium]|nr:FAD:protein FMN transferase [Bacteroidaceae bacterium]